MKRLKSYRSIFESLTKFEEVNEVTYSIVDGNEYKFSESNLNNKPHYDAEWKKPKNPIREMLEVDLRDILLEIEDLGYSCHLSGFIFSMIPHVWISNKKDGVRQSINFDDIEDTILRIEYYLNIQGFHTWREIINQGKKSEQLYIYFDLKQEHIKENKMWYKTKLKERYRYIDKLPAEMAELKEFEDELAEIEKTFLEIPKDEILDIITEFEDFIKSPIERGDLRLILWQSGIEIVRKRISTSFDEVLFYYETGDFYKMSSQSIKSRRGIKFIESETLETIFSTKKEPEIEYLLGFDVVKSYFTTSIKDEALGFLSMIKSGWMPCLALCNIKFLKNWQQSPEKIDLIWTASQRLDHFVDYKMVFLPKSEEPSIIFIHKKYII